MAIKERVKRAENALKEKKNERLVKSVLYFTLGLIFSTGSVIDGLHPFGVSITAVSKKRYFLFSAAGAVLGSLIYGLDEHSARYICAVTIAALGALASSAFELGASPAFSMGVSFFASLVTGLVLNVKSSSPAGAYALTLSEAILSLGGAFFFYRALHSSYRRLRLKALPSNDLICIIISLTVLVINISEIRVFVFSPSIILAAFLVLTAVRFFGEGRGIILALALGFGISISGEGALFMLGALAFSALLSSLFSPLGRLASGAAFITVSAFFGIASASELSLVYTASCALGTALFLLLPQKAAARLEALNEKGRSASPDGALRQSLVLKLRFASSAMAAISESVEQVREKINDMTRRDNELKKDEIGEKEYIQREIILEKTNQIRRVASDQFYSISGMLEDLAFEFDEAEIFDSAASSKIRRLLGEHEIYPINISVIEDKFKRIRVEILTDSGTQGLDNPKLAVEIGKACSRYFDKGKITNFKNEAMLSFTERPNYRLSLGFAQHSAEGRLCGDTVKILSDSKGRSILIISDGMGKGSRAALDGAMGAGLLSKLINAGFGFDSALKIVNSALLIKSNDESLATLDVACVDLFTGKCELFKAGAPASFILRGESVIRCELTSMPAGILRGIEFARRTAVLRLDDMIVLMSDGISDVFDGALDALLSSVKELEAQSAADRIINEALAACEGKAKDDMSIIIAKLERNI